MASVESAAPVASAGERGESVRVVRADTGALQRQLLNKDHNQVVEAAQLRFQPSCVTPLAPA